MDMDTTKKNGSISIRLQSGKELRLSSSDKDMQLDVCSLQYHLDPTDKDSEKPDSSTIQATTGQHLLASKQRTMDRNQLNLAGEATIVSKTEALQGLVKAIVYLETLSVFSSHDIEYLWDIYERINSKDINQQYLRDLGEASNDILVTEKQEHADLGEPEVLATGREVYGGLGIPGGQATQHSEVPFTGTQRYGGVPDPDENVGEEREVHYGLNDYVTQMVTKAEPQDTPDYQYVEIVSVPRENIMISTSPVAATNNHDNVLSEVNAQEIYDSDHNTNRLDSSECVTQTHHIVARPLRAAKRKYKCDQCSRRFQRRYLYDAHMRMHDGIVPFKCKICDRVYHSSTSLRSHMGFHNNASHQCYVCGKSFYRTGLLSTHMRSHDEVKRYACSICGKRSATSSNNISHMKTHTDNRDHKCEVCGKSFRRGNDMKKHQKKFHQSS